MEVVRTCRRLIRVLIIASDSSLHVRKDDWAYAYSCHNLQHDIKKVYQNARPIKQMEQRRNSLSRNTNYGTRELSLCIHHKEYEKNHLQDRTSTFIMLHSSNIILSAHAFAKALWQVENELHSRGAKLLNRSCTTLDSILLVPRSKRSHSSSRK